jgi:1,4-dihydroxy-2-naphthoyl-CoA hydrolase
MNSPAGPGALGDRDPNDLVSPLDRFLGLRITYADGQRVEATMPVTGRHLQAHGIAHGGIYCTVIETVASIGATLYAGLGQQVVGVSNRTSFIRALRSGRVRIAAERADGDGDLQFWSVRITDEGERLVATGYVQLLRLHDRTRAATAGTPSR